MKVNKCASCFYGGNLKGFGGSTWKFKKAYKKKGDKVVEINYDSDEKCGGCRMSQWNEQEEECIANNHKHYVDFYA
jgi:hypothetical protein